ncbi:hypothetical protein DL96DRAFT_1593908 [Flagelloscypha sp. PMI_526]|nr:hypothetical protein DL96DRAFT_1593908 [Flagelloscypha sp. PMI_526]
MASLHFCQECNNLLYPKADNQRNSLVYACRICPYEEPGQNSLVYRNDLLTITKEKMGIITDLGTDVTLPWKANIGFDCPACNHHEAVSFQDQSKRKETRMILFYVCVKCNHAFTDPKLGLDVQPSMSEVD